MRGVAINVGQKSRHKCNFLPVEGFWPADGVWLHQLNLSRGHQLHFEWVVWGSWFEAVDRVTKASRCHHHWIKSAVTALHPTGLEAPRVFAPSSGGAFRREPGYQSLSQQEVLGRRFDSRGPTPESTICSQSSRGSLSAEAGEDFIQTEDMEAIGRQPDERTKDSGEPSEMRPPWVALFTSRVAPNRSLKTFWPNYAAIVASRRETTQQNQVENSRRMAAFLSSLRGGWWNRGKIESTSEPATVDVMVGHHF